MYFFGVIFFFFRKPVKHCEVVRFRIPQKTVCLGALRKSIVDSYSGSLNVVQKAWYFPYRTAYASTRST